MLAALGVALWAMSRRAYVDVESRMQDAARVGYAEGISEPGELAVFVASSLWPDETWPPLFGDPQEKEQRYADVWVTVTSFLAGADGFRG